MYQKKGSNLLQCDKCDGEMIRFKDTGSYSLSVKGGEWEEEINEGFIMKCKCCGYEEEF